MFYKPIVATLGYVLSADGQSVLMVHRNARPDDQHCGKYNGLGGKLASGEHVVAGMRREILEEANIECTSLILRGTLNWPVFGPRGESWLGFVFLVTAFRGTPCTSNSEGTLEWVPRYRLLELPLWSGDHLFLPLVFDTNPNPFHGVMSYDGEKVVSWDVCRCP